MLREPVWTIPPVTIISTMLADQLDGELPWHIKEYGIDQHLWPKLKRKIKIGIVDTGVSPTHPEFDGLIAEAADFTGSKFGYQDGNGHGTHCLGIMVAKSFGVYRGAKAYVAKGLTDQGTGSDRSIASAIAWCGKQGCNVINLSAGSNVRSPMIVGTMAELAQQGVIFSVAAGNESRPGRPADVGSPANEEFLFGVTAIDRNRKIASFSNRGESADVAAPGVEIRSCGRQGTYVIMSGTSMAAPWVTGYIAAYMDHMKISTGNLPSFDNIMQWLTKHSTDLGKPGKDWEYGLGLPDAESGFASGPAPLPPQKPDNGLIIRSIMATMNDGSQVVFNEGKKIS